MAANDFVIKILSSSQDMQTIEDFVNKPEGSDVRPRLLPNVNVGTLSGLRSEIIEKGGIPATPFDSYSEMLASSLADGKLAIVMNDINVDKNGYYSKQGGQFRYSEYNSTFDFDEEDIRQKLKIENKPAGDLFYALTDKNGNLTDLQLGSDGLIPDIVLTSWAQRIAAMSSPKNTESANLNSVNILPQTESTVTTFQTGDTYFKDGELLPVFPDTDRVILVGSSSAALSESYISAALKLLNPRLAFYPISFGGAIIEQQAPLIGNNPLIVKAVGGKINATGDTEITVKTDVSIISRLSYMSGWLNGIEGRIKLLTGKVYFSRTSAGTTDTIAAEETPFLPMGGNQFRNAVQIIWIGKNNLTSSDPVINDVKRLLDNTNKIIDFNASLVKRCVVMTHYVDRDTVDSDPKRARIAYCNHLYKLRYKQNVFDVESILLGSQIFTDLSITRTASDISHQARGNLPPSLARDSGHCLDVVYEYIAQKLALFIDSKNYLGV